MPNKSLQQILRTHYTKEAFLCIEEVQKPLISITLEAVREWLQEQHFLPTYDEEYENVEDELLSKKKLLEELDVG